MREMRERGVRESVLEYSLFYSKAFCLTSEVRTRMISVGSCSLIFQLFKKIFNLNGKK